MGNGKLSIGLQGRIVFFILTFGILTGFIGITFTYLSGINAIKNSIGTSFRGMAAEVATKTGIIVEDELNRLRIYAITPLNFQGSKVLGPLRAFQKSGEGRYAQILLTDSKGKVVGSTNNLGKDDVTNEDWWKGINSSKNGLFIGDIKWDTIIESYAMDFAVRIEDKGRIRGAVMATVKVDHLFKAITDLRIGETGHANLVSSDGTIIVCPIFPPKSHTIPSSLLTILTTSSVDWDIAPDDGHGGNNSIIGFAPVGYTLLQDPANFGGKKWYIFIRQHPRETYAGIRNLLWRVSIFAASSLVLISMLGFLIARRMVKPIKILQRGAILIGKGDLDHHLDIRTGDEIEQLASEFNIMANKLKRSLESEKLAAIGILSMAIAHEIRNPLSSIKMNLQILYKSLPLEDDRKEHFRIAMEEVEHLERILQNLLDFARPPEPYFTFHELDGILDASFHLSEKEIKEKRIKVIRNYAEGSLKVFVDAGKVKQALVNLYLNAIQAMEPEGVLEVSTAVIHYTEKAMIKIVIGDNGCGMDDETLKHIFEPFFTTKSGGTGLGLPIVKKIIGQHKGEIVLSSERGKGTRVTISLPLV